LGWSLVPLAALALGCTVAVAPGSAPPPGVAVADDGTVYPTEPPPDPIPELAPPSPGYDYVWINGYWDWGGADWTWYSGYWVPRAEATLYVAPRFVFIEGRPVYYRSYWRGEGGRRVYGYGWRGAPPPAYRARPQVAPHAWRAEHNQGWRAQPGAGTWRGSPAPHAAGPGHPEPFHPGPAHAEPGHPGWGPGHNEPGHNEPGAFHPGPPGAPHPGPPPMGQPHPGGPPAMGQQQHHPGPPAGPPPGRRKK
jgi:hypothetical protein